VEAVGTALLHSAIYLTVGALFYSHVEGWSPQDSIYFCIVTMSTVGYGDMSPSHDSSKLFTLIWIVIGICAVFVSIHSAVDDCIRPYMQRSRDLLEQLFPQTGVDILGDGLIDYKVPRHPVLYYCKGMLPSFLLNVAVQLVSASAFRQLEGWRYGDAVWHTVVTATTVGYGDLPIQTVGGRLWACFHILLSVCLLGELIGSYGDLKAQRSATLQRIAQLSRRLDKNLVENLLGHATRLRPLVSRDGKGLTELEFSMGMLLELGIVKWEEVCMNFSACLSRSSGNTDSRLSRTFARTQVRPFIKQFRKFDTDRSGRVGLADIEVLLGESQEGLEERLSRKLSSRMLTVEARSGQMSSSNFISFNKREAVGGVGVGVGMELTTGTGTGVKGQEGEGRRMHHNGGLCLAAVEQVEGGADGDAAAPSEVPYVEVRDDSDDG
jgi:hypothetical protein